MSELAEIKICEIYYKINWLNDGDNNAMCYCNHNNEARAKELQFALKDSIVT